MAKKKTPKKADAETATGSRAKFPYTNRPGALRKFLAEVPKRPRPTRVNASLMASWALSGGANLTIIRVLKAVGLLNTSSEPTDKYTAFMDAATGPTVLGTQIRELYAPLFGAALEPHREPPDRLRNLFNIHSGGATIDLQIQTFKALCDNANFTTPAPAGAGAAGGVPGTGGGSQGGSAGGTAALPVIHIDLHIHLPENKSSRDYQYIIQDIAHFLYGQKDAGRTEG